MTTFTLGYIAGSLSALALCITVALLAYLDWRADRDDRKARGYDE